MRRIPLRIAVPLLGFALVFAVPTAWGIFIGPSDAPVERLVRNLTSYVEAHPRDAQGHYLLGRVHSLAFTLETRTVGILGGWPDDPEAELPNVSGDPFQKRYRRWKPAEGEREPLSPEETLSHAEAAVRSLRRSIALRRKEAHVHLGLAYVLETAAPLGGLLPTSDLFELSEPTADERERLTALLAKLDSSDEEESQKAHALLVADLERAVAVFEGDDAGTGTRREHVRGLFERFWTERAIESYLRAFELGIPEDLSRAELPMDVISTSGINLLTSYEAGRAYRRLVRARGATRAEEARLAAVGEDLARLEAKPPASVITPIVFSLDAHRSLDDLLAPEMRVLFDLDGDGLEEAWPWVAGSTGILVWDPDGAGRITSGRQLFGSVTWWLFFPDGYRALDALDDDRSGALQGDELRGLAVWFDRDSDGWSDAGEVETVEALGIRSLATSWTERIGPSFGNPCGLTLGDGRVLPTYDWVTRPAADPSP